MDLKTERPLEGLKVLVVEDDEDSRELLCNIVELAGARAASAQSTSEALETHGTFQPDVLVTDIGLPREDGYALIDKLRALEKAQGAKSIPAIALTGYGQEEHRDRIRGAGFQLHLVKPVDPEQLIQAIAESSRSAAQVQLRK